MPSSEPNKEMEDLLKAYAQRRRDQGRQELPSEMHPASRAMLQTEVRRAFESARPAESTEMERRWPAAQWQRLVTGGILAALLVFVIVTSVPPTVPRTPALRFRLLQSAATTAQSKSDGQRFVQVNNVSQLQAGAPAAAKVLATFQVERHGSSVLVLDSDGSVYTGNVLEPALAKKVDALAARRAAYDNAKQVNLPLDDTSNYSFKVSGLNNDLKQNVVFTGNVFQSPRPVAAGGIVQNAPAPTAAPSGAIVKERQVLGRAQARKDRDIVPASPPPSNQTEGAGQYQIPEFLRLTGTVQVEGGGEYQIEAQPPGP